ncbi:hypothetical protein AG1IA_04850 [Rhizoctonia solani AG-1 IA]|uniref:Uncharacterized protein n=1 Tax=Thanatephorus cucumeris (strain AG1-IA) TaxID=983506 RepID=L8WWE6_THACA|nr:hypothetical protein AG1IA_04850 [Rhizoctonia solani AG-1 IA]
MTAIIKTRLSHGIQAQPRCQTLTFDNFCHLLYHAFVSRLDAHSRRFSVIGLVCGCAPGIQIL